MWDIAEFFSGLNTLSKAELEFIRQFERRGRKDIADIVRNRQKLQRLLLFNGGGMTADVKEFEDLFQSERSNFGSVEKSYQEWRREAIEEYEKIDPALRSLLSEEECAQTRSLNKR